MTMKRVCPPCHSLLIERGFLDEFVLALFQENIVLNQSTVFSLDFKQREGLPVAAGVLSSRRLSGCFFRSALSKLLLNSRNLVLIYRKQEVVSIQHKQFPSNRSKQCQWTGGDQHGSLRVFWFEVSSFGLGSNILTAGDLSRCCSME